MRVAHYQCLPALGVHHICRMTETQKRGNIRNYICELVPRDDSDQTHGIYTEYTENFTTKKNESFQMKNSNGSNEYPQSMF